MKREFKFVKNPTTGRWVIQAPERASRPNVDVGTEPLCPFCPGRENLTPSEVYRVGGGDKNKSGWQVRVVPNKYPFAPVHEVIIDSPDHNASFFTYKHDYIAKLFKVYKDRFTHWQDKGQVVIFYNYGIEAAASLPHPHAQLAVVPKNVQFEVTRALAPENIVHESSFFTVFVPEASGWPYEVWFLPKNRGRLFGEATNDELNNLAPVFSKALKRIEKELRPDFPFNFHIYHGGDWYLRLIPRLRTLGGFEIGTGIFVHSKSPKETAKKLAW